MKLSTVTKTLVAVAVAVAGGMLLGASPATAAATPTITGNHGQAYGYCGNNTVCLRNAPNGLGMYIARDGTYMANRPGYAFFTEPMRINSGMVTYVAENKTLGRFCLYNRTGALQVRLEPGQTWRNGANPPRYVSHIRQC